jgi:hypothetical protein
MMQDLADEASSRGPPTQEDIEQGLNRIQVGGIKRALIWTKFSTCRFPGARDLIEPLFFPQGLVAEQLDDISANGRLPAPPTPDEVRLHMTIGNQMKFDST